MPEGMESGLVAGSGVKSSAQALRREAMMIKKVNRYSMTDSASLGAFMELCDDGEYVEYEDVKHLLQDEPSPPQICHWRACNEPMAPGDSYLCAGHREHVNRGAEP
jgi:hypothetical protein